LTGDEDMNQMVATLKAEHGSGTELQENEGLLHTLQKSDEQRRERSIKIKKKNK